MFESKDGTLVVTSIVLAISTLISMVVEMERQATVAGRMSASKYLLLISTFFALTMTCIICTAAAKGLGANISATEFAHRESLQKLIIAALPPYFLCNMFVKHAWLTFYYGLTRTRNQRWFIHFMQFTAVAFGLSSVMVILLQCIPLNAVWRGTADAKCINLLAYFYFNASFMIVNDIVMYLIPMVLLWKVEMIRDHRWSLYALFAICFVVIIASILRLVAVYEVDTSPNLSQNYALVFLWASVENHVGICAACAGSLKTKCRAAYKKVRTLSIDLKNKSWLASRSSSTSTAGLQSQVTEDRTLYDQATSNASSLNDVPTPKKGPDFRTELIEMHPGMRLSVTTTTNPKAIHVPSPSLRGPWENQ